MHCQNHGGPNEVLPPGDPGRGGAPRKHGFYSDVLHPEDRELYEEARTLLGKLDEEIALARTNLARYQRTVERSGQGGIPTSVADGGKSVSVRPYADIVQEYLNLIGRLEKRRAEILHLGVSGAGADAASVRWEINRCPETTLDEALANARRVGRAVDSGDDDDPGE